MRGLLGLAAITVSSLVSPNALLRCAQCRTLTRIAGRSRTPLAQLVRIEPPPEDGDAGDGDAGDGEDSGDGVILSVSRVDGDEATAVAGRSVASMQFMITNAMRASLLKLGYSRTEIDGMDPARAAQIISSNTASSKQVQRKAKSKRERFELQFTCNVCEGPNSHSISYHAYTKGTVVVTCPGCQTSHLIADHLNWIEDDFRSLEEYMARRGTPVTRLVTDGVAAESAAGTPTTATQRDDSDADLTTGAPTTNAVDARRPWRGTRPAVSPLDGITDDQARRIKEAIRRRKTRKRAEDPEQDS